MTINEVIVRKYVADEGKVFDYAEPHFIEDENGNEVREHLYARVLYLSPNDDISNYIEVYAPKEEE